MWAKVDIAEADDLILLNGADADVALGEQNSPRPQNSLMPVGRAAGDLRYQEEPRLVKMFYCRETRAVADWSNEVISTDLLPG